MDLERCVQRLIINRTLGGPRDIVYIRRTLRAVLECQNRMKIQVDQSRMNSQYSRTSTSTITTACKIFQKIVTDLGDEFLSLLKLLNEAFVDSPPLRSDEGGLFKPTYLSLKLSPELLLMKQFLDDSDRIINELESKYREETKKASLKISRNVFDLYVEVSRKDDVLFHKFPKFSISSNTKVKTRYHTFELTALRDKLIGSHLALIEAENVIYEECRQEILLKQEQLLNLASTLSELDVSLTMAKLAMERKYCRPVLTSDNSIIEIHDGRHAVVEQLKLANEKNFIENDCQMHHDIGRFHFITGPNMGGKSTYLRQIALIILMAHCGFYVPAKKALIGLTDAIYTRIGSADNLSEDQSTFMKEMQETADILRKATSKSLVIMDEIGRGTCHKEGISIAQAVCHYLYHEIQCKTLFATHYHELGLPLLQKCPGMKAFQTTAKVLPVRFFRLLFYFFDSFSSIE